MTEVVLFEDNPDKAKQAAWAISRSGHHLHSQFDNLPESLTAIVGLGADVGIVIVDGGLLGSIRGTVDDGMRIVQEIKSSKPKIVTIGNSVMNEVPGARYQTQGNLESLLAILSDLPK